MPGWCAMPAPPPLSPVLTFSMHRTTLGQLPRSAVRPTGLEEPNVEGNTENRGRAGSRSPGSARGAVDHRPRRRQSWSLRDLTLRGIDAPPALRVARRATVSRRHAMGARALVLGR